MIAINDASNHELSSDQGSDHEFIFFQSLHIPHLTKFSISRGLNSSVRALYIFLFEIYQTLMQNPSASLLRNDKGSVDISNIIKATPGESDVMTVMMPSRSFLPAE